MATKSQQRHETVDRLLERYGETYAEECGIRVDDKPAVLYQLLVMSVLMSARIGAQQSVKAMRGLLDEGWTTPQHLADSTWRQRTDVLNSHGYARYDERTSKMLGELADMLLDRYGGDLRRLHDEARDDVDALRSRLVEFKGLGPAGADIFLREVQAAWDDVYPFVDDRAARAARRLDLPTDADALAELCPRGDFPKLVAALVRVELDDGYDEVRGG